MQTIRHGLSIGIARVSEKFYLQLRVSGKLTHEDYGVITPMLEAALEGVSDPKIKVLADISELDGWEPRAAWDDLKLGLKHGSEFERIAIVGHKKWQEMAAKIGSWFVCGDLAYFEEERAALDWLHA